MQINKGNYRGSFEMVAEIYTVDEEYESYIETLSLEELKDELIDLKMQLDALEDAQNFKGWQ